MKTVREVTPHARSSLLRKKRLLLTQLASTDGVEHGTYFTNLHHTTLSATLGTAYHRSSMGTDSFT